MNNKEIVNTLKSEFNVKVALSRSPRKGDKWLWVAKMVKTDDQMTHQLNELVTSGRVDGWTTFSSRDGNTVGLQCLVG